MGFILMFTCTSMIYIWHILHLELIPYLSLLGFLEFSCFVFLVDMLGFGSVNEPIETTGQPYNMEYNPLT